MSARVIAVQKIAPGEQMISALPDPGGCQVDAVVREGISEAVQAGLHAGAGGGLSHEVTDMVRKQMGVSEKAAIRMVQEGMRITKYNYNGIDGSFVAELDGTFLAEMAKSDLEVDAKRLRHRGWNSEEHEKLVRIYSLAPFLFGKVFQPDIWIKYLYEVGLLPSPTPTSVDALEDKYMFVVEILEFILNMICTEVKADQETKIKNLNDLFEDIDNTVFSVKQTKPKARPLTEILDRAKKYDFLHSWKDMVKDKINKDESKIQLSDREIAVAMLFACRQYVENAYKVTESLKIVEEFKTSTENDDKKIEEKKEEGNKQFKAGSYIQASQLYTQAIYISPFNHILYGNRAQSYLNSGSYKAALSDGKRAIVLAPDWHKGYYRYAQAFWDLGEKERCLEVIDRGLSQCPGDKNLLEQRTKYTDNNKESNNNQETNGTIDEDTNGDSSDDDDDTDSDVPALTSSSEDNYDSDSDVPPLVEDSDSEPEDSTGKFSPFSEEVRKKRYLEKERKKTEERKRKKEAEQKRLLEERRKQKEEEKKERQKKREEKEKQNSILMKAKQKEDRQFNLYDTLRQGSEALLDQRAQNAAFFYQKALDMLDEFTMTYFVRFGEIDLILLKYSVGTGSVDIGTNKEIQCGVKWFQEIIDKHRSTKFPLALLGLGRAYYKQCRFEDALKSLKKGVIMVKSSQHGVLTKCTWPGTTNVIEETKPGQLKIALEDMIIQCKNPPPPTAICRYKKCQGHYYKIKIYITDPDFKGFVRLMCFAKCIIEYHIECWRKYKKERLSQSDKDYLNMPCTTPDCPSKIARIHTYDQFGVPIKELDCPEQPKAPQIIKRIPAKMKASSVVTLNSRAEKKRARKLHKLEEQRSREQEIAEENDVTELIDRINSNHGQQGEGEGVILGVQVNERERASSSTDGSGDATHVDMDKFMTVLNKKEEEDEEQKQESRPTKSKSKKKQRVAKVTMSLDEFCGPTETTHNAVSSSMMDCIDDFGEEPFKHPSHLKDDLETFENLYDTTSMASSESNNDGRTADIKDTLFSFFLGMLQEHGPLNRDDIIIQRELEDFPAEAHEIIAKAGGIDKFLLQSLQFAVIDNFVCLLQDTVKARQLSELDKDPLKRVKKSYAQAHNPSAATGKNKLPMPKTKPVTNITIVESKSRKLDELDTFSSYISTVSMEINSDSMSSSLSSIASSISGSSDNNHYGMNSSVSMTSSTNVTNTSPSKQAGRVVVSSVETNKKQDKKQETKSSEKRLNKEENKPSNNVKKDVKSSSIVDKLSDIKDDFKKQVYAAAGKSLKKQNGKIAEKQLKINGRKVENSTKKGVNSPKKQSSPEPETQSSSKKAQKLPKKTENDVITKIPNKQTNPNESVKLIDEPRKPLAGDMTRVIIREGSASNLNSDILTELESETGGLNDSIDSCEGLQEINHLDINIPSNQGDKQPGKLVMHQSPQNLDCVSSPESPGQQDMWKNMTISDISSMQPEWAAPQPGTPPQQGAAPQQADWHSAASLQWGNIAQDAPQQHSPGFTDNNGQDSCKYNQGFIESQYSARFSDNTPQEYSAGFSEFIPLTKDVVTSDPRDLGQIRTGVSTPNSEDINIGTKFGPIGSHAKSYSPAHGSSKSSSLTGTPIHTPQADSLPHFPSLHSSEPPFSVFGSEKYQQVPPIISTESEADQYNDETFGIPADFSETSQDYIPDPISLAASSASPFMNSSVWSHDQNPQIKKAPMNLHQNLEQSVQNEMERQDDMFINEVVDSVYSEICENESFKNNPHLRENIKADVIKDIQRSKMSVAMGNGRSCDRKRKVATCDVMCQYEWSDRDAACNTEPYEPFKQDYLKAVGELEVTSSRLQELMDKHTQLQNCSGTELRSLRSLVDALEQECKGLRRENKGVTEERDTENKKWTNEKRALSDEVKNLRKELKNTKYREEHVTNVLAEHQQKVQQLDDQVKIERDTIVSERQSIQREMNELQQKHSTQLSRAESAEEKYLQLKVEVGTQILERSLKDAEMYALQFSTLIQGMRDNKQTVPPQILTSCDQWKGTVQKIREIKDKSMSEFEEQIRLVRQGTPLSTLPMLQIPRPPPPPETNMAMMRGGPGFMRSAKPPPGAPIQMPPPGLLPPGALQRPAAANKQAPNRSSPQPTVPTTQAPPGMFNRNLIRPSNTHKSKNAYEKVMDMLGQMFPSYAKTDLNIFVQDLRRTRNGSLSGMSLEQIVRHVADMVIRKQQQKMSKGPAFPPPKTPPAADQGTNLDVDEIFEEEEDPCIICHDELEVETSIKLECGHRYHGECIKKWFNEQSTCPTCRVHALLPEDFPTLG